MLLKLADTRHLSDNMRPGLRIVIIAGTGEMVNSSRKEAIHNNDIVYIFYLEDI